MVWSCNGQVTRAIEKSQVRLLAFHFGGTTLDKFVHTLVPVTKQWAVIMLHSWKGNRGLVESDSSLMPGLTFMNESPMGWQSKRLGSVATPTLISSMRVPLSFIMP